MTRPRKDEIECKEVEALKLAVNALFHSPVNNEYEKSDPGYRTKAYVATKSAISDYSPNKEYSMPEWRTFSSGIGSIDGALGEYVVFNRIRIYEGEYNAIREALAREVK